MGSLYDFDAPQFLDLREVDTSEIDRYFDKNDDACKDLIKVKSSPRRLALPVERENCDPNMYLMDQRTAAPPVKKSALEQDAGDGLMERLESLTIGSARKVREPLRASKLFEGIELIPTSAKKHSMKTRADATLPSSVLSLRNRSILKLDDSDDNDDSMVTAVSSTSYMKDSPTENFEQPTNAQSYTATTASSMAHPRRNLKRRSDVNPDSPISQQHSSKFIALAEQVANFYKTPDRFRSRPLRPWKPSYAVPTMVVAKTPKLSAIHRSRKVDFPDRSQREQLEYEEMMRHQVKANPLNEKILKEVRLGLKIPVEKRPTTRPEPFKLTEIKPKPIEPTKAFEFKAQPIPKRILQSPCGIPRKEVKPVTTPKTPHITMPTRVRIRTPACSYSSSGSNENLARNTKVEPFSFEARDKAILAKKEAFIKSVLEEEKKHFNSFKAHAAPMNRTPSVRRNGTPVKDLEKKNATVVMPFNLTMPSEKKQPEIKQPLFKAKPATVLKQRPFYPVHQESTPLPIEEFHLKTELRSAERAKFNEKLKAREEEIQAALEKERQKKEAEEIELVRQLRLQAEFKANPIPHHKIMQIKSSAVKLTDPKSPNFLSGKKK